MTILCTEKQALTEKKMSSSSTTPSSEIKLKHADSCVRFADRMQLDAYFLIAANGLKITCDALIVLQIYLRYLQSVPEHHKIQIMESDDVWGEELPDETIDELFRASQSCTQLTDNHNAASSNCFTEFRIPNIQAKQVPFVQKNPVNCPPQKKSVFVPRKVSRVCLGQVTNSVVKDRKAFDNAFQLSKEFHISSDSLKLSQEVHRLKEPVLYPSCSKHDDNYKRVQNNSKVCMPVVPNNFPQLLDDVPKQQEVAKTVRPRSDAVKSKFNGAKCSLVKLNEAITHNNKTLVNTSLCAELINLQQKSEKVKRNKYDAAIEQTPDRNNEAPSVPVIKNICEKERSHVLPGKFNGLAFAEWKSQDSKPKINFDLSKHTHQSKARKFNFALNLLKIKFPRGILFGDLLGPRIFEKSHPESPLIELRNVQNFSERKKKKQVHFEKLLADYSRLNNVSMYQNRRSIEHCYTSLHNLILLESLDSQGAKPHIEKIVCEVAALLGDQLALLQELKLSITELQDLDRESAEMPNRGQALSFSLTSPEFWYEKEVGLEARRGLGALAALATLSQHAINLVMGTAEPSPTIQVSFLQKHDSSPFIYKERQSGARETHIFYRNMKFGFLTLLRDLCTAIRQERRALAYTGVLAGVVSLLIASRISCCVFPEESNRLLCEIVKEVVFCRPRIEVVVVLVDLLCVTNTDAQIGRSLCRNCSKDKYIEKCRVVYFHSEDSCVLQVLCCLLESQRLPAGVHADLCHQMVRWLSGSFLAPSQGPHWLQPTVDDVRPTCACRRRVAEVTCNLLHRAFIDFVELSQSCSNSISVYSAGSRRMEMCVQQKLRNSLRAGIVLIHRLEDRNPDFMINVANSEGEWQSFVLGCSRKRSALNLTAEQLRCLEELVASVEVDIVTDVNQAGDADMDVMFEHLWKDNLRPADAGGFPEADGPTIVGRCVPNSRYSGTAATGISAALTHARLGTQHRSGRAMVVFGYIGAILGDPCSV
ncbi:hypothetical protein PR048_016886 [Dryococelus australis]|uniref:Uncharacterized protein n=1 Tax=Dryococelus australis TaxID=614101 RepID=A0ABQ9H816_9NEOP|nr:hypothetical protein PR048_016886 [Dryococelus australis]